MAIPLKHDNQDPNREILTMDLSSSSLVGLLEAIPVPHFVHRNVNMTVLIETLVSSLRRTACKKETVVALFFGDVCRTFSRTEQ
jgi:hypothetical protein